MLNRYLAVLAVAFVPALASAQSAASDEALAHLDRNQTRYGLSAADIADVAVTDAVTSRRSGSTHVYLRQRINGIEVVGTEMTVNVDRRGNVYHTAGQMRPGLATERVAASPALSASAAADITARAAGLVPTAPFVVTESLGGASREVVLSEAGVALEPVRAGLVYVADAQDALRLAWQVNLYQLDAQHNWDAYVDATTGEMIRRNDLVVHCSFGPAEGHAHAPGGVHSSPSRSLAAMDVPALSPFASTAALSSMVGSYRVYPLGVESPIHTTPLPPADGRALVANPDVAGGLASPFGWHDTNGVAGAEFTRTQGNNVHAYIDRVAPTNTPDPGSDPDGGAGLVFDFPVDYTAEPTTYQPAAVANLFYWNNVIHDVLWQYGFDEVGGSFQENNYGRGGLGSDYVQAEAQDGSGTNNANFNTPVDGQRPRMQMYLWNAPTPDLDGDFDSGIIVHEYGHGISNRLTGGPSNVSCLNNAEQMGEGWSDWYGLMMTQRATDTGPLRRGIGTYALNQPVSGPGIRAAPYSTSFVENNFTYQRTRTAVAPHGVGHIWATALWEATWALISRWGYSPNLYDADGLAGNQVMMQLVTEAMKLQPCSPGFVSGRDAILAADNNLYGGIHRDSLWAAFARRGLGASASQGSTTSNADNTEAFNLPEFVAPAPITNLAVVPGGDYVRLTFTATGDDGNVGTASVYDVRYSTTGPITSDALFAAATPATGEPAPQVAGTAENIRINGLTFSTTYHFAIKVVDDLANVSPLSNPASGTTLAPPVLAPSAASVTVAVAQNGTATVPYQLQNTGASELSYAVSFNETTPLREVAEPEVAFAPEPGTTPADKNAPEARGDDQLLPRGGPDAFGYSWIDSDEAGGPTYVWNSIVGLPGTVQLTLSDDAATTVPIGFPFEFYGAVQSNVNIVSNGFLNFGTTSTAFTNANIPTAAAPNNMIAGFWDDLDAAQAGTIHYLSDVPGGKFTVQWTGVQRHNDPTSFVTFQIVIRSGGAIEYYYNTMTGTTNSATIGVENATGTVGLPIVFNGAYVHNNMAVRISSIWVSAVPASGTIAAGAAGSFNLVFDAAGLAVGAYTADMSITTNVPGSTARVVPITMNVTPVGSEGTAPSFSGTHLLSSVHPNPAGSRAQLELAVADAQDVRVSVYDALGRRVALLHEGALAAGTNHTFALDGSRLAAGAYVVRVEGETFADTRRVTLVK